MPSLLVARVLLGALVLAQAGAAPRRDVRNPALDAVIDESSNVPPEFAADVLTSLATAGVSKDRAWDAELLERAFTLAGAAELATPFAVNGRRDTRAGALALASGLGLDRVTLQARIATATLKYDRRRARELFSSIQIAIDPTPCREATVPNVDPYYRAVTTFADEAFGTSATERDEALRFVELAISRARLPRELTQLVTVIRDFGGAPVEQESLLATLAGVLDRGIPDPRGFAVIGFDITRDIAVLADQALKGGLANAALLMQALRRYVVMQLAGPRCADAPGEVPADMFNAHARAWPNAEDGIRLLTERETMPVRFEGRASMVGYWISDDARRMRGGLAALSAARGSVDSTAAAAAADRYLTSVIAWTGDHEESREDFFQEKAELFVGVIGLASGGTRERAIREYLEFVKPFGAGREQREVWFYRARALLQLAREGPDGAAVLDLLEHSGQPVLSLYAHAQRVLKEAR